MGLNKTKPRASKAVKEPKTDQQLVALMAEQNRQTMELMGKMIEQIKAQSEMTKSWLDLFKPPATPTRSTNLEDREAIAAERTMWTELDATKMQQELAKELGLGLGKHNDDDDGIF